MAQAGEIWRMKPEQYALPLFIKMVSYSIANSEPLIGRFLPETSLKPGTVISGFQVRIRLK